MTLYIAKEVQPHPYHPDLQLERTIVFSPGRNPQVSVRVLGAAAFRPIVTTDSVGKAAERG